jgi:hypothetical protein
MSIIVQVPLSLLRAGGRILTRSPTGVVFVLLLCSVTWSLCSVANLPIGESFRRLSSHDGRYGVVSDGNDQDE